MKRIPKFLTAYDTLPTVSSEESKGLPELMLVDTGEKRNITFKDNSPFRAYFTGTDTYLPMAPWADTADTYAYSHDGSIYRVPKQGFEPSTDDLNAHLRHDRALNETTLRDFDKLMLAYLGLGTAPITLPAATSNVLTPMVMNPVSTALGLGGYELGSRGFDNVMQRYAGKNWSEYMKDKYNMPEWASGLINPVGILTGGVGSLAGRMYELLGKNALKQGATALGREALAETAPATQEIPWNNPDGYYVTPQIRRVNFGADVAAGENGGKTGVMKILPAGNKGSNSQVSEVVAVQPEVAESAVNKVIAQTSPQSTRSFSAPVRLIEPDGRETISKDEIERILQDRLNGRVLSDNEKYELELELFSHGDSNSGKRFDRDIVNGTGEDIDLALNNLNRRYNQEAIARGETPKGLITRDLSKGETPYELEELVENGRLKSDAALDESVSGNRGMSNWYSDNQEAKDIAQLYFNVVYGPKDRSSLGNVGLDNPRDRSGVIFTTDGYQYSIDSFPKALKEFWNTLRSGRRFAKLDTQNTHVESNDFGLANRYTYSDRDAPFFEEVKTNQGAIPNDIENVIKKNDGSLVFKRKDDTGAVRTYMLRARSPEEIINKNLVKEQTGSKSKNLLSINEWIDRINTDFGESIGYKFPHARVNSDGEIEWPNMYGVFYKKGGTINNINNGKQRVKIIGNTKKA